jgi:DNA end-binding protein Ku
MASTVWKGELSFGLLTVPIKLTSAARKEDFEFHMLHKTDKSRLKQVMVCKLEDRPVLKSEISKGFEYEKDHYVEIEDAELERVTPKTAETIAIVEFVKAQDVEALYLDNSYYVAPGKAAGERVYALLYKALIASGYVGVARIAMNHREHVAIVRAGKHGLVMHTLFYADELRQVEEFRTDTSAVKDDELRVALKLMTRMHAAFEPQKYRDTYRESVMQMIAEKTQGKTRERGASHVVDVAEALRRSLKRNDVGSPAGSARGSRSVSRKPHTNAHRSARRQQPGVTRVVRASGAPARQQKALGDPLLADGGRGSAPQGTRVQVLGTPKRSLSGD